MADYRDWCHSCGAEINFDSHNQGCAWAAEVARAERARRDFERMIEGELERRDADDLIKEALELTRRISACDQEARAAEKKLKLLERHIFYKGYSTSSQYRKMQKEI